ncbi:MAG TPA: hypothetical protein VFM29_10060 [Vicinamibacteria bacterium]|nr:hypothetical protein [Vicinamibacteria bacterium]
MARRERRARPAEPDQPPREAEPGLRACCLVSEVLEEAGVDRETVRRLRRQMLQGLILLCQWQLERMDAHAEGGGGAGRAPRARARRVPVEQG